MLAKKPSPAGYESFPRASHYSLRAFILLFAARQRLKGVITFRRFQYLRGGNHRPPPPLSLSLTTPFRIHGARSLFSSISQRGQLIVWRRRRELCAASRWSLFTCLRSACTLARERYRELYIPATAARPVVVVLSTSPSHGARARLCVLGRARPYVLD